MKKISRKEAIQRIGLVGLSPIIPAALSGYSRPYEAGRDDSSKENEGKIIKSFFTGRIVLQPFEYGEAILHNGSLNRQVEYTKDYYLNIPNDDLLKGFRERAGLPTYGAKDLGGWYTLDAYHIFGQLLSGFSRLYAVSEDDACKGKVAALIDGWGECLKPDGYFFYTDHPYGKHYIFDKMVGGLVDAFTFTGHRKALEYLSTITDWALKNLDKERPYAAAKDNLEWYTLSENLYRAYQITRDKKYFEYAQHWEYTEYWYILAKNESIFQKPDRYHAYSHLNTLSGAAMAYLLKGEEHYLDTLRNGYDFFQEEQCFATGGYGPWESLAPKDKLIELFKLHHTSFETQCGTWAAFKLCKYLLLFTGDARYGDWIEKLIYNGAGASIPLSPDGKVFYYSDYNPREGAKKYFYAEWSCCSGTRPDVVSEYSNLIYFKTDSGLFINLYTPSSIAWNNLVVTQETRFPEDNIITFRINSSSKSPVKTTLHFRRPGWLTGTPGLFVNKQEVRSADLRIVQNWIVLTRNWKDNDEVKLEFPMELGLSRLDHTKKYPAAITYGPVVLAIRSVKEYPSKLLEEENPFQYFEPVQGEPLNWHLKHLDDLLIKPFYTYKEKERYILYIDPSVENRILEDDLITEGNWERYVANDYFNSSKKGASITAKFEGKGVRLYLSGSPGSGKCEVWIDKKLIDTIDTFRTEERSDFYKDYKGLDDEEHVVTIKVLDEKNDKSSGTVVNINAFEVLR